MTSFVFLPLSIYLYISQMSKIAMYTVQYWLVLHHPVQVLDDVLLAAGLGDGPRLAQLAPEVGLPVGSHSPHHLPLSLSLLLLISLLPLSIIVIVTIILLLSPPGCAAERCRR